VILVLEQPDRVDAARIQRLRLSADPDAPRLHLQRERAKRHDGPLGPFFRRLATDLPGGAVIEVAPVRADRIALVEVRGAAAGERRALVLELFGRRANLVLLGPGDRVIDVLVPPPSDKESPRLAPGALWQPPVGRTQDPGPALAACLPAPPDPEIPAPLSWRVESALGGQADLARRAREVRDLTGRLERRAEKARGLVRGLEARLAATGEIERLRSDGELLKANLPALKRGMSEAIVEDFFAPDAPPRRVEMDPRLSPSENVERIFERARKLERSRASVETELEIARRRARDLSALLARAADPASEPADVEQAAIDGGLLEKRQPDSERAKQKEVAPRLPYRIFLASRGGEIRVGRSARDNDALTFRHSKGSDLWLHTADAPGSHVVLVLQKGAAADSEEMVDAAHLAVHFSPLKGAGRARVHVASRKEVHKPRGAKPGLVQLSGGKILDVRMQPERLRRLLGQRGTAPEGASAPPETD
jgi:predicted ribosome quality control (RQC) complex YloA/Tae2 family protein